MTIIKCYLIDISLWEIKRADVVVIIIFFNKSWEKRCIKTTMERMVLRYIFTTKLIIIAQL